MVPKGETDGAVGSASDVVAVVTPVYHRPADERVKLYDMATGAAPVTVELGGAARGQVVKAVGSVLVVNEAEAYPKIVSASGGTVTVRQVEALHENSLYRSFSAGDSLPGVVFGRYSSYWPSTGESEDMAVVDLATGRVTERYAPQGDKTYWWRDLRSISPSHVAWTERADGKVVLASAKRGSAEVTRVPLDYAGDAELTGGLLGDWFMSDDSGAATPGAPRRAFTARSLTDGTTVPVLAHAESVTKGPGNTLIALGVTAEHGEGVYRIAVGADGKPAAELIASTGETDGGTAPLEYAGNSVPAVIDLDGVATTRLAWKFSSTKADLVVELTHKASSRRFTQTVRPGTTGTGVFPDGSLGIDWAGVVGDAPDGIQEGALNGAYTWKVTAKPWNGMPAVTATGEFTVTRTPKAHDYTDNGSPDLFVRPASGYLDRVDTLWDDASGRLVPARPGWASTVSRLNWNAYDRIESAGDLAGSTAPDVISRDKSGVLWLHLGNKSGFVEEPARKVGGGWGAYNLLAGGSELTGDGRADLVAVDKAGDLYLYEGTGYASAPYAPRKKIGFGWGIYNDLVAVGNVAGGPAGDLVARDKAGVLWLYLGKGDGSYAQRVKIGGGWNEYRDIVGIGDGNKDGRPDLYVRTATNQAYFYAGTGSWRAPFAPRSATQVGVAPTGTTYHQVF
ncbi:hypothetical protein O1L60_21735 [Streptomyces diastatochromogenes]|nr:hypothetical protein [Streptomyces diastatochromogenes]